jgi:hypothetical protein
LFKEENAAIAKFAAEPSQLIHLNLKKQQTQTVTILGPRGDAPFTHLGHRFVKNFIVLGEP